MTELYLDGYRAPIESIGISLTAQANNIAELKDRQATFTNKFKCKLTPELTKRLNFLGIVGSLSRKPYEILTAKLVYNGVEVLENGNGYISKVQGGYIDVSIYDGNILLFQEIGSKTLQDLDLSDLTHSLSLENYLASFTNTEGYIYAVSDNGKFDPDTFIEINYQLPSIFVHTIWSRIFQGTSFEYSGDIFSSYKFLNKVITPKRGYNAEIDIISQPIAISETIADEAEYDYQIIIVSQIEAYEWDFHFIPTKSIPNQTGINNGSFILTEDGQYTYDFDLTFNLIPPNSNYIFKIWIIGGGTLYENTAYFEDGETPYSQNEAALLTFSGVAGDVVRTEVWIEGSSRYEPIGVIPIAGTVDFNSVSTTVIDINVSQFIGDLGQAAFIKDIMQHFGLSIQIAQGSNIYQFKKMQDILRDYENAEDWSDKYIRTKDSQEYQLKGYAQKNRLAYNYYTSEGDRFGDGFLEVRNKNLPVEQTIFTRPYNACETSKVLLNDALVTYTPYWEAQRDDTGTITAYKPITNKNYIAEVVWKQERIDYGLTGGAPAATIQPIPRLSFENMGYQRLLDDNYAQLKEVLDWNLVRNEELRLTGRDVKTLDFFKLKYIKQLSNYFYVNKAKYRGGPTSMVELVQVRKTAIICDLVARPGSYPSLDPLAGGGYEMTLDGSSSEGNIDFYLWKVISNPGFGSATIATPGAPVSLIEFNNIAGDWTIQLTVWNGTCQATQTVIITTNV